MVSGEISEKEGKFGLKVEELFFSLKRIKNVKIGQRVTMAVRPEDVRFTEPGKDNSLIFTVYSTLPTGADIFTRVYK
jgi:hypothetical protein